MVLVLFLGFGRVLVLDGNVGLGLILVLFLVRVKVLVEEAVELGVGLGMILVLFLVRVIVLVKGTVEPPLEVVELGVRGVVMVKTMARGKQRRSAQRREKGLGDSMFGGVFVGWGVGVGCGWGLSWSPKFCKAMIKFKRYLQLRITENKSPFMTH